MEIKFYNLVDTLFLGKALRDYLNAVRKYYPDSDIEKLED